MNTKSRWLGISAMLSVALVLGPSATKASTVTKRAPNGVTVTKIYVSGRSADLFLNDTTTGTNGFLNASSDEVTDTTALDFSYATPDEFDPDQVILLQGVGEIPSGAFTTTVDSAVLKLTTPMDYVVTRCVVNTTTAEFSCAPTTPITFSLTWVRNGLGSVIENTKRIETIGPVTTKLNGKYSSLTATVNGEWGGHLAADLAGNLLDSQNTTHIREITIGANP